MASDDAVPQTVLEKSTEYESRGLFDFMKKDDEEKVIAPEFDDKIHVTESEPKFEECKVETTEEVNKPTLLDRLHRSNSNSSSSDEEVEEGGEKKKKTKGLKEKIKEKIHKEDTKVPVEVVAEPEEKKGLLEKIKDKLPGSGDKKVEEETVTAPVADAECTTVEGEPAKKGIMEKIKEKIPGHHAKASTEEEEKKDKDCA